MSAPKAVTAMTLSQYAGRVEVLLEEALKRNSDSPYKGNWYRGVGTVRHTLIPSLYRHPKIKDVGELIKLERVMINDFERQNVLHNSLTMPAGLSEDIRSLFQLFFLQHYGIPTRLLDWSTNPFISLYFALSTARMSPDLNECLEDAAVWVLDPVGWNCTALHGINHGDAGPLSHDSDELVTGYGPRKLFAGRLEPTAITSLFHRPAAIHGVANNARMFAQRGVFTVFGSSTVSIEQQFSTGGFPKGVLTKIVIPKTVVSKIFQSLLAIGFTDSVSYPDLSGLAMEIKRSRGFRVNHA